MAKFLVLGFAGLWAQLGFACPSLQGRYLCTFRDSEEVWTITQTGGPTPAYTILVDDATRVYQTDDIWRPLPEELAGTLQDGQIRARCETSDQLKVEIQGKQWISNAPVLMEQWLSKSADGELANSSQSKIDRISTPRLDTVCKPQ